MGSHPRKKSPFSTIFLIVLVLFSLLQNASAKIRIEPKTGNEKFIEYDNLTECISTAAPNGQIRQIEMNGICANVYPGENCEGGFARMESTTEGKISLETSVRVGDKFVEKVKSLGPCWEKCDPRNWDNVDYTGVNFTVEFWDKVPGNRAALRVNSSGCIALPIQGENLESIKVFDNKTNCVEFHDEVNCGGESVMLRPKYPDSYRVPTWTRKAKAFSQCGAFCPKISPEDEPRNNTVTLFDHSPLNGSATTTLNLTTGCVTLDHGISNYSIKAQGQCVMLYDNPNCTDGLGHSYRTNGTDGDNIRYHGFYPNVLRSIVAVVCDDDTKIRESKFLQFFTWEMITLISLVVLVVVLAGIVVCLACKKKKATGMTRDGERSASISYRNAK